MMKIKKIILFILVFCMTVFLCGCGFTDKLLSNESNELTTASMFGGNNIDAQNYNKLINQFSIQNGIEIKDISSSSSDTWKKMILRQFETGSEPDVVFFFNDATAKPLINSNKVVSIEEIRKKYLSYASNIDDKYLKDGYSVPIRTFAEGLFYNKKLFEDLKIEPPKDYAELLQVIEKINLKNKENLENAKTPISLGVSDYPHYMLENLLLMEMGGEEYSKYPQTIEDKEKSTLMYMETFKKLNELKEIKAFGEKDIAKKSYEAAKNEFLTGESYIFIDGSWLYPSSNNHISVSNIGVAPFPVKKLIESKEEIDGKTHINTNYGENIIAGCSSGYFISRRAWGDESKRDNAVKFVEFMTKDSSVLEFGSMTTLKNTDINSVNLIHDEFNKIIQNSKKQYLPIGDRDDDFSFEYLVENSKMVLEKEFVLVEKDIEKNIEKFLN